MTLNNILILNDKVQLRTFRVTSDTNLEFVDGVIAVQASCGRISELLEKNVKQSPVGFLISGYKKEDLLTLLEKGGTIDVACELETNRVVGYIVSRSGEEMIRSHPDTQIYWNSKENEDLYGSIYSKGKFTYLDQIGIHPGYQNKGFGEILHQHYFDQLCCQTIIAAVVCEPVLNQASNSFFLKLKYKVIGDFFTSSFRGIKNVKSFVYIFVKG